MYILYEDDARAASIINAIDLQKINEELSPYSIKVSASPQRQYNSNIWMLPLVEEVQTIQSVNDLNRRSCMVRVFVDLRNRRAFAMAGHGVDKTKVMLIASVVNKHIQPPFRVDTHIRYEV